MPTNYPTSLDSLTNPTSSDPQNNPSHSGQHANANDAIEAIETFLGTSSAPLPTILDTDGTLAANSDVKIASQKAVSLRTILPEGFLLNGKIAVTVSSNNLTVAIKTLSGTDPSSTNPVQIRINGSMRSITSALSVTKNAGTNWCNAGSSELATKEIDYFVYLGYNSTDGVVLGFSRIPYGTQYSDFSTTTTNEKYCAISTITNASSSDYYDVIGRFSATLSAGAGYTWSVPTFTASNLIQRPIYETRTLSCISIVSSEIGSITSYDSSSTRYKVIGNTMYFYLYVNVTNNGTGGQGLSCTKPFTGSVESIGTAKNITTGNAGTIDMLTSNTTTVKRYENSYLLTGNNIFSATGIQTI